MGKFCQCLTELSASDTIMAGYYSLFLFISLFCEGGVRWTGGGGGGWGGGGGDSENIITQFN